jgi:hypothetical protein
VRSAVKLLDKLERHELIAEFDEVLWYGTVDQVRVTQDGKLRFILKDGAMAENNKMPPRRL